MKKIKLLVIVCLLLMASNGYSWDTGETTTTGSVTVVDALDSTSATSALSANQGKVLNDGKLSTSGTAALATNLVNTPFYAIGTAAGTDTYTATATPTLAAYAAGQIFIGKFTNANTSTTPTLNVTSKGAITMIRYGGGALVAGDIPALGICWFYYDGTNMNLLNPGLPPATMTGTFTFSNGATPGSIYFQEGGGTDTQQLIGRAAVTGNTVNTLPIATNYIQGTAAEGATTEVLVGGGASTLPVWTTATGTGAPVRAGSPTFTGTVGAAAIAATGVLTGQIKVTAQTADANVTAAELKGNWHTIDGAHTMTFTEEGAVGDNACFSATTAAAFVLHPHANDSIIFTDGVDHGHDTLTSPATAGSYVCILMTEATHWTVMGTRNTFTTP